MSKRTTPSSGSGSDSGKRATSSKSKTTSMKQSSKAPGDKKGKASNVLAIMNNRGEVESVAVLNPKAAGRLTFVGEEGRAAVPIDSNDRAVTDKKILRGEKGEEARDNAFAMITKIVTSD